ncbi:hypothetical protein Q8F55_006173 [Vanrija albida]|uniref:MARVEL domain-containing protein n=1 Tax=Vanrija albida TaxID=181172 RepID=A0ABR3PWH6_9TREE
MPTTVTEDFDLMPLTKDFEDTNGFDAPKGPISGYQSRGSRAYRLLMIGMSVVFVLATLSMGIVAIIFAIITNPSAAPYIYDSAEYWRKLTVRAAWKYSTASKAIAGAYMISVLVPIGITAAVFAGRRKPSKPWMWITTLVLTVLLPALVLGLHGAFISKMECWNNGSDYSGWGSYCRAKVIRNTWFWPALNSALIVVAGVYFTVFFFRNKPDLSKPIKRRQPQLLIAPDQAQVQPYGAHAAYGAPQGFPSYGYAAATAPQPDPSYAASYAAAQAPQEDSLALPTSAPGPTTAPPPSYYAASPMLEATAPASPTHAPAKPLPTCPGSVDPPQPNPTTTTKPYPYAKK